MRTPRWRGGCRRSYRQPCTPPGSGRSWGTAPGCSRGWPARRGRQAGDVGRSSRGAPEAGAAAGVVRAVRRAVSHGAHAVGSDDVDLGPSCRCCRRRWHCAGRGCRRAPGRSLGWCRPRSRRWRRSDSAGAVSGDAQAVAVVVVPPQVRRAGVHPAIEVQPLAPGVGATGSRYLWMARR